MFLSNAFVTLSCYDCLFVSSSHVFLWSKLQYTNGVSLLVSSNADPEVNCREKTVHGFTTSQYSLNSIQSSAGSCKQNLGGWFHVFVISTLTWERFPI